VWISATCISASRYYAKNLWHSILGVHALEVVHLCFDESTRSRFLKNELSRAKSHEVAFAIKHRLRCTFTLSASYSLSLFLFFDLFHGGDQSKRVGITCSAIRIEEYHRKTIQ